MTGETRYRMDWPAVIEHNRLILLRIVARLFALAGLDGEDPAATLPRYLRSHILRILRPVESALRRLIVIAAKDLTISVRKVATSESESTSSVILGLAPRQAKRRRCPRTHSVKRETGKKAGRTEIVLSDRANHKPHDMRPRRKAAGHAQDRKSSQPANPTQAFPVLDPLKHFATGPFRRRPLAFPRITAIGVSDPRPIPENWLIAPDDPVDAMALCRRLLRLKATLDDIPRHAARLARWNARRRHDPDRVSRLSALRPVYPPGRRRRATHEVDDILKECHALAMDQLREPDTS